MIITWGEPADDKEIKNVMDQVSSVDVQAIPGAVGNNSEERKEEKA